MKNLPRAPLPAKLAQGRKCFEQWRNLQTRRTRLPKHLWSLATELAREFGLGVAPWSPLRGGVLTGKYTRENAKTANPERGARVTAYLGEETFVIIDELVRIATTLGTTPAAVALAWVQAKAGVTSTIIGARTMDQLEQNLAGLDVTLDTGQMEALDKVSEPLLAFPMGFLQSASMIMHAGATVNGEASAVWPMAPKSDSERF